MLGRCWMEHSPGKHATKMASDLRSMEISLPRKKAYIQKITGLTSDFGHVPCLTRLKFTQGSSTTPVPCFVSEQKSSFTMLATVAFWCMEAQTALDESKLWLPRVSQAWDMYFLQERSHSKFVVTFFGGPPFIHGHTSSSIYPNLPEKKSSGQN